MIISKIKGRLLQHNQRWCMYLWGWSNVLWWEAFGQMEQFVSLGETGDLRPEAHLCADTESGLTAAPQPLTGIQCATPRTASTFETEKLEKSEGSRPWRGPSVNFESAFELFLGGATTPIESEALSTLWVVCKLITVLPTPPMNTIYLMSLSASNYLDDVDPICLRWWMWPTMWNYSFSGVSSCHFWQRFFQLFVIKYLFFLLCFVIKYLFFLLCFLWWFLVGLGWFFCNLLAIKPV